MATPRRAGRPRKKLPKATALLTRRVRRLIDLAHEGNLNEASRVTGISYPTLRDLYVGRTVNPSVRTLEALRKPYDIYLQWFTDPAQPEQVLLSGLVGLLPPHPQIPGRRPYRREVTIPFAAWPMYNLLETLNQWLDQQPADPRRPIVGDAKDRDFIERLTSFLLGPLLAVEREFGTLNTIQSLVPLVPQDDPTPEQEEQWVRTLRALGEMWQHAMPDVLERAQRELLLNVGSST